MKLKPCPFCNKKAVIFDRLVPKSTMYLTEIGCQTEMCPCWIPPEDSEAETRAEVNGYVFRQEAIDAWELREGK